MTYGSMRHDGSVGHDGSMGHDGSWVTYTMGQRGHGSRKVTGGPLWLAHNLKEQLIMAIKKSEHFAIQLDETTDVGSDPQLMVYVRYEV